MRVCTGDFARMTAPRDLACMRAHRGIFARTCVPRILHAHVHRGAGLSRLTVTSHFRPLSTLTVYPWMEMTTFFIRATLPRPPTSCSSSTEKFVSRGSGLQSRART